MIARRYCKPLSGWALALVALVAAGGVRAEPWVLVDSKARTVAVMDQSGVLERFEKVALGTRGAGVKLRQGDDKTPVGSFRITDIRPSSRYGLFIGLDYPNLDYARLALFEGRISDAQYRSILRALEAGRMPPASTPLGGEIGLHGVGRADPRVHHAELDWTSGCIALADPQIQRLAALVRVGTRVEIR